MKAPTTDISATPFSETMPQDSLGGGGGRRVDYGVGGDS